MLDTLEKPKQRTPEEDAAAIMDRFRSTPGLEKLTVGITPNGREAKVEGIVASQELRDQAWTIFHAEHEQSLRLRKERGKNWDFIKIQRDPVPAAASAADEAPVPVEEGAA